jgi:hypothetical protein
MKPIPSEIVLKLLGEPSGYTVAARFCRAVAAGAVPESADMQAIAVALSELFDQGPEEDRPDSRNKRLQRVARTLGLFGTSNKRPKATVAQAAARIEMIVWLLRKESELAREGRTAVTARAEAKRLTAAQFHKSASAVRDSLAEFEEDARQEMHAHLLHKRLNR